MSFPHRLKGLTTREAIADAVYRLLAAYDENDIDLLSSALTPDIVLEVHPGQSMTGFDTVKAGTLDRVGSMATSHFVTNLRIDVDNDKANTASVTCNVLAQHYPPGKGIDAEDCRRLLGGTKYAFDLVRMVDDEDNNKDDIWKIKKWDLTIVWSEGDLTVLPSA